MASRGVGQHKSEAERAQDAYDKQADKVTKMVAKRDQLSEQLSEIEHELAQERDMLAYYEKHPMLENQRLVDAHFTDIQDELPIEVSKSSKYQGLGIGGRYVEADK